jgi:NTE family protein
MGENNPQDRPRWPKFVRPLSGHTEIIPVLSGGGTCFPAHVGVLRALEHLRLACQKVIGLSGGSIVAALYCAGVGTDDMEAWTYKVNFGEVVRLFPPRLLFRGGMCSGRRFEAWMDRRLAGARFRDLRRDLVVVATDIRTRRPAIFSKATTPDLPVARAVRFSMGIPVLFDYQQHGDMILVDGEILASQVLVTESLASSTPVVVFQVGAQQRRAAPNTKNRFRVSDYFVQLADAFVLALSSKRLDPWAWQHTVLIDTSPIPPIKFNLSRREKNALVKCGYETTLAVLPVKLGRPAARRVLGRGEVPDASLPSAVVQHRSDVNEAVAPATSAIGRSPAAHAEPRSPSGH